MPHFFCPIFSFETKTSCEIVGDAFVLPDLNQQRPKINLDLHESINQPIRAQSVGLSSHIDLVGTQKGKSARTKKERPKNKRGNRTFFLLSSRSCGGGKSQGWTLLRLS